ncbi:MAG: hypothetical protein JWN48_1694 [Myxococcaceae bacterium]|nr:hypothetical protein [Myxococcaceae bacterium]
MTTSAVKTNARSHSHIVLGAALASAALIGSSSPAHAAPELPKCSDTETLWLDYDYQTGTELYQNVALCMTRDGAQWRAAAVARGGNDYSDGVVALYKGPCSNPTTPYPFAVSQHEPLFNTTSTEWKPYWGLGAFCAVYAYSTEGGQMLMKRDFWY